jgi:hypothetical protein
VSALAENLVQRPARLIWTPPNLFEEMERRRLRLLKCNADPELQQLALEACAADVKLWINDWVWTFDPRQPEAVLPFLLFPRQEEYLDWRGERKARHERGEVEKSRDMGVSWLNVADQTHDWLFVDGHAGGFGSRKAESVDNGDDPSSIFAKIRFLVAWLPRWMRPAAFDWRRHSAHMRIINPSNGNTLVGEAGPGIGRGGRVKVYDLDEAAHVAHPHKVEASLAATAEIIFESSTPAGGGTPFARRCRGGVIPVFRFHWRDDPRKDDAWYAQQKATLDSVTVAQEIDIDHDAAVKGILIPMAWISPCIGRRLYEEASAAICIGGDIGESDDPSAAVVREGRNLLDVEEWTGQDPAQSANRFIAIGRHWEQGLQPHQKLYFFIDRIGIGSGVVANLRAFVKKTHREERWVIVPVQAGAKSVEPVCHRLKDALWWRMRLWFQDREPAINPEIEDKVARRLAQELSAPTYGPNDNGLIEVESKKKLDKRGVRSPNLADALMHTFLREQLNPAPEKPRPSYEPEEGGRYTP